MAMSKNPNGIPTKDIMSKMIDNGMAAYTRNPYHNEDQGPSLKLLIGLTNRSRHR